MWVMIRRGDSHSYEQARPHTYKAHTLIAGTYLKTADLVGQPAAQVRTPVGQSAYRSSAFNSNNS
jgi:hypothetical protein